MQIGQSGIKILLLEEFLPKNCYFVFINPIFNSRILILKNINTEGTRYSEAVLFSCTWHRMLILYVSLTNHSQVMCVFLQVVVLVPVLMRSFRELYISSLLLACYVCMVLPCPMNCKHCNTILITNKTWPNKLPILYNISTFYLHQRFFLMATCNCFYIKSSQSNNIQTFKN